MRIAFAGNPNSGKTTMYNALTGRNERVGNWAGVTVEKKESAIRRSYADAAETLIAVDLPGAYSMSPFTSEESITSAYVRSEHPDVIVNIVDATNLSRSLFFTTQLLELGIPVVVALNKSDINRKKETRIDTAALSAALGCPVVETVSTADSHTGLAEVVKTAAGLKGKGQKAPYDEGHIDLTNKEEVVEADKKRFAFVNRIVAQVETRKVLTRDRNAQDKIDAVLTNPVAGVLIFASVMFLVFDLSQSTLGPWLADALVAGIETFQAWVGSLVENAHPLLQTLLVDGIIGGVGAVVGFLPLVMVMYFLIALLVGRISGYKNRRSFFIMELPEYKVPSVKRAFISMCARGWAYIVKAGTVILVCNTVVQIMQTFTWSFQVAELADTSILASVARPFAYLLVPVIGVASWQMAAAAAALARPKTNKLNLTVPPRIG